MVSTPGADNNKKKVETELDPVLLQEARKIYQTYCLLHNNRLEKRPVGVAIDPKTYRGQLVFGNSPVLLPEECFISLKQIEKETP